MLKSNGIEIEIIIKKWNRNKNKKMQYNNFVNNNIILSKDSII